MIMCPVTHNLFFSLSRVTELYAMLRLPGIRAVFPFFLETYNNEDNSLMEVTAVQTLFDSPSQVLACQFFRGTKIQDVL